MVSRLARALRQSACRGSASCALTAKVTVEILSLRPTMCYGL